MAYYFVAVKIRNWPGFADICCQCVLPGRQECINNWLSLCHKSLQRSISFFIAIQTVNFASLYILRNY
jgi:hypothetical protein